MEGGPDQETRQTERSQCCGKGQKESPPSGAERLSGATSVQLHTTDPLLLFSPRHAQWYLAIDCLVCRIVLAYATRPVQADPS